MRIAWDVDIDFYPVSTSSLARCCGGGNDTALADAARNALAMIEDLRAGVVSTHSAGDRIDDEGRRWIEDIDRVAWPLRAALSGHGAGQGCGGGEPPRAQTTTGATAP